MDFEQYKNHDPYPINDNCVMYYEWPIDDGCDEKHFIVISYSKYKVKILPFNLG